MPSICFYFQVHQPFRIRNYSFFDIGQSDRYEDDKKNEEILNKVADKCYLNANRKMLELIRRHEGKFKISYSISGTAIEQFEKYRPDVLRSFIDLANTGCVEFLAETYYHSLSFIHSRNEFRRQVEKHGKMIEKYFKQKPVVFRNTELIYNNELAAFIEEMGYKGIICEGVDKILNGRSPNFLYKPVIGIPEAKLLLKNHLLSDDIAFRFSDKGWKEFPLTADKFSEWVYNIAGNGETVNLFMDYETFGEHQWESTGIFDFLDHLPTQILKHPDFDFKTPSEVTASYPARDTYDAHSYTSWADTERDLSAWLSNSMQQEAFKRVYSIEKDVLLCDDGEILKTWRKLQTSDHYYYMCTKFWNDGDVHKYFSPYDSPYDAYMYFMNVFSDLECRVRAVLETKGNSVTYCNEFEEKKPASIQTNKVVSDELRSMQEAGNWI
ncbi:MAG TPA: glycoside hydrolase family 57 protein [Bacteroidia bacterium]|jgi:alpha-amylase|nr:glycoside hydrolase family 57 protein [Bacteroidia bacterium]